MKVFANPALKVPMSIRRLWIDAGNYEAEITIGAKPLGKKSTHESWALRIVIYGDHHGDKPYRYLNFSELSGEKLHTIKLPFSKHAAIKTYIKLQVIILESIILRRLSSRQIGQKTIISFNGWGYL